MILICPSEAHSLELHSPDRLHSLVVRCPTEADTVAWYNTLHGVLRALKQQAMCHANRQLQEVIILKFFMKKKIHEEQKKYS